MASPRLNLAVRRCHLRLRAICDEGILDRRSPDPRAPPVAHESPAKSTRLVGAAWKVTAVKWRSYTLRTYGVCRWYIRRGPHVWNLVRLVHVRLSRHGHDTNVPRAMARTLTLSVDRIGKIERKIDESPVEYLPCRMVQIKRPDCLRSIMSSFRGSGRMRVAWRNCR